MIPFITYAGFPRKSGFPSLLMQDSLEKSEFPSLHMQDSLEKVDSVHYLCRIPSKKVDSLHFLRRIPSKKVDSLHYLCRIPSKKVDSLHYICRIPSKKVDSLHYLCRIPSKKVDSLHYLCTIPSKKVPSSILIRVALNNENNKLADNYICNEGNPRESKGNPPTKLKNNNIYYYEPRLDLESDNHYSAGFRKTQHTLWNYSSFCFENSLIF